MPDISHITLPDGNTYNLIDATVPHTSETAASGGTALSLVTTGEKYTWNNRTTLAGLSDTYISSSLKDGNPLVYSSSSDRWQNSDTLKLGTILIDDQTSSHMIQLGVNSGSGGGYGLFMDNSTNVTVSINGANGSIIATSLNSGLQSSDISIADGDKLVVTDSSDNNKVRRASLSFDGSTTTQCLTKKGTWATFGTSNLAIGTTASTAAAGNHTHGSITNAGAITGTTALASGDGIIFADSSDSSKLKRSSITFDGSTTTKCLTQAGTWANFTNNAGTVTGSGTANYLAKWSSGSGLTNGALYSYVTSGFTAARCTVVAGGYQQIGKVVHVDIHIKFTAATSATQVILGVFPEEAVANVSLVGTVDGSYQDTIYGFRINARNLYANGSRSSGGQWHVFGSYIAK